jgi:hypothetical protein
MTPPLAVAQAVERIVRLNDQVRDTLADIDRLLAMPADQ